MGELLKRNNPKRAAALLTEAVRLIEKTDKGSIKVLIYQVLGEINFLFGNYAEADAQITQGPRTGQTDGVGKRYSPMRINHWGALVYLWAIIAKPKHTCVRELVLPANIISTSSV